MYSTFARPSVFHGFVFVLHQDGSMMTSIWWRQYVPTFCVDFYCRVNVYLLIGGWNHTGKTKTSPAKVRCVAASQWLDDAQIILPFLVVIRYEEYDQDGGCMIKVCRSRMGLSLLPIDVHLNQSTVTSKRHWNSLGRISVSKQQLTESQAKLMSNKKHIEKYFHLKAHWFLISS